MVRIVIRSASWGAPRHLWLAEELRDLATGRYCDPEWQLTQWWCSTVTNNAAAHISFQLRF